MPVSAPARTVDVRDLPPRERHSLIFSNLDDLGPDRSMELVNDHDPRPLYERLQSEAPGAFGWDYLERGPDVWRVRITRLAGRHGNGQCCGSCGGV